MRREARKLFVFLLLRSSSCFMNEIENENGCRSCVWCDVRPRWIAWIAFYRIEKREFLFDMQIPAV